MPKPFRFMTSVQSVQLTGFRADNLDRLTEGLSTLDGSSIYHHTHRFYRAHSFLGSTPLSDFAYWVGNILQEHAVAERIASLDLRDYRSIRDLRTALIESLVPLRKDPDRWSRRVPPGLEFHFCRSVSLVLPTGWAAQNLEQFTDAIEGVDTGSLYFHLIEAPLRLDAETPIRNDLSAWLEKEPGHVGLANAIEALNPYRSDLEGLRRDLLSALRPGSFRRKVRNVLDRAEPGPGPVAEWFKRWREDR